MKIGAMNWEEVRALMLERLEEWVRATQPGRAQVDVFTDPVWAVYACSKCDQKRVGFANVRSSYHKGCGSIIRLENNLTYAEAKERARSSMTPLGITFPEGLPLTIEQKRYCKRRLITELEAGIGRPGRIEN